MDTQEPGDRRSTAEETTGAAKTAAVDGSTLVVPVIQEELKIDRQQVETGRVRIHKTVTEREEVLDEPVYQEEVQVERVAINRPVEGPVPIRYEGDTMIVPLLEEVMVVEKRLMLKEELHIRRRRFTAPKPQKVVLRSEQVEIERVAPEENGPPAEVVRPREAAA